MPGIATSYSYSLIKRLLQKELERQALAQQRRQYKSRSLFEFYSSYWPDVDKRLTDADKYLLDVVARAQLGNKELLYVGSRTRFIF